MPEVEVKRGLQGTWDVWVPTVDGQTCVVTMKYDALRQVWIIEVSAELLYMAPEAITATLNMAVLAMKNHDFKKDT